MKRSFVTATVSAIGLACAAASLVLVTSASADRARVAACSPSATILASPRSGAIEVQAKAINNRGDIMVGFARLSSHSSDICRRRPRPLRGTAPERSVPLTSSKEYFSVWREGQQVCAVDTGRREFSDGAGSAASGTIYMYYDRWIA